MKSAHRRVPQNCVTKTDTFWVCAAYIYIMFVVLLIFFGPGVEIRVVKNHYLLVCISKYRSHSCNIIDIFIFILG